MNNNPDYLPKRYKGDISVKTENGIEKISINNNPNRKKYNMLISLKKVNDIIKGVVAGNIVLLWPDSELICDFLDFYNYDIKIKDYYGEKYTYSVKRCQRQLRYLLEEGNFPPYIKDGNIFTVTDDTILQSVRIKRCF